MNTALQLSSAVLYSRRKDMWERGHSIEKDTAGTRALEDSIKAQCTVLLLTCPLTLKQERAR